MRPAGTGRFNKGRYRCLSAANENQRNVLYNKIVDVIKPYSYLHKQEKVFVLSIIKRKIENDEQLP